MIRVDKKSLKKIPVKEYINAAQVLNSLDMEKYYLVNAYQHEEILALDLYNNKNELSFRIFHTLEDWIVLEGNKWRKSGIERLFYYWPKHTLIAGKESMEAMRNYLKTENDPIEKLVELQEEIRKQRLAIVHKKEMDEIDAYMEHVKPIPEDFYKWIDDEVMKESRYIIYEYKKAKLMKGRCTHCESDVMVSGAKHNVKGKCPSCNSVITFKASGKFSLANDKGRARLVQSYPGGAIVREFSIWYRHENFSGAPRVDKSNNEYHRKIITDEYKIFHYGTFKSTDQVRWNNGALFDSYESPIYPGNIQKELKGTRFQYSGLWEMVNSDSSFRPEDYLNTYLKGSAIEYLAKLGLHKLALAAMVQINGDGYYMYERTRWPKINLQGKTPTEVLGIGKYNFNRAVKLSASLNMLKILQLSESENLHIQNEHLLEIESRYSDRYSHQYEDFFKVAKLSTVHQVLKYTKDINFGDYMDYIDMAEKLNWNMRDRFVLFPRHFKEAHDQASALLDIKIQAAHNKSIAEFFKANSEKFNFDSEEYLIRLPMSAKEIAREGKVLHHCVGSYIERVASGERLILFIRGKDNPHDPLYTMELEPETYRLIQVRGANNGDAPKNVKNMISKYQTRLKKYKKRNVVTAA